jgi:hypothetical protein
MINLCLTSVDSLTRAAATGIGTNLDHIARTILTGCGFDDGDAPTPTRMSRAVDRWLADTSREAMTQACRTLADVSDRPCDPLGATLLRDAGVNPFALLAIERLMHLATNPGHVVRRGQASLAHIALHKRLGDIPYDVVTVLIAPGVWWDGAMLSLDEGLLPETALHAATGLPLRRVIDMPAFDGVTVTGATPTGIGTWQLRTDRRVEASSWAEALGMMEMAA